MSTTEHDTEHPAVPEANAAHPQSTETRVASRINALTSGLIGVGIGLATGLVIGLAIIPALGNLWGRNKPVDRCRRQRNEPLDAEPWRRIVRG